MGAVKLNGRKVRPSAEVRVSDRIEVAYPRRLVIVEVLAPLVHHPAIEALNLEFMPPGGPIPWGADIFAVSETNKAFTDADTARESGGL